MPERPKVYEITPGCWQVVPKTTLYMVSMKDGIVKTYAQVSRYALGSDPTRGPVGVAGVIGCKLLGVNIAFDAEEAVRLGENIRAQRIEMLMEELAELKALEFRIPSE